MEVVEQATWLTKSTTLNKQKYCTQYFKVTLPLLALSLLSRSPEMVTSV